MAIAPTDRKSSRAHKAVVHIVAPTGLPCRGGLAG